MIGSHYVQRSATGGRSVSARPNYQVGAQYARPVVHSQQFIAPGGYTRQPSFPSTGNQYVTAAVAKPVVQNGAPVPAPEAAVNATSKQQEFHQLVSQLNRFCQNQEEESRKSQTERSQLMAHLYKALGGVEGKEGGHRDASGVPRPMPTNKPPFFWVPSADYTSEFDVSGMHGEVVTKTRDFEDQGWVIPVSGTLRIFKGSVYRWTLQILKKCVYRPQLQFGIHGVAHEKPWRLVTTSRCSRSRDDEPWQDRPQGDRLIDEADFIHVEVDMRGLSVPFGVFSYAINDEAWETAFQDIPLDDSLPLMPIVSMGGNGCSVSVVATD